MSDETTHSPRMNRPPRTALDELATVAEQTGTSIDDVLEAIDTVGPDRGRVIALLRRKTASASAKAKAS